MPGTVPVAAVDQKRLKVYTVPGSVQLQIVDLKGAGTQQDFPMDRDAINKLIVQLREARDYSYGKDQ